MEYILFMKEKSMKRNMGATDRIIRLLLAIIFGYVAFVVSGVWAWVSGVVAGTMLLTVAVGFCPLYAPFGISTCKTGVRERDG
jgi:O-antigen/teichoic acid export membrane protein